MKRFLTQTLFILGAATLLGLATSARAGEPAAAPLPLGPGATAPVMVAPAPGTPCAPACDTTCLKKVCVPGTDVKVTSRRVYGEVCEDFCMPKCGLPKFSLAKIFGKKEDCNACPEAGTCANCEHHIYQKKFLVVRVKQTEEIVPRCHVELQPEEPACRTPLFGHKHAEPAVCLPETVTIQSPAPVVVTPGSKMPPAPK